MNFLSLTWPCILLLILLFFFVLFMFLIQLLELSILFLCSHIKDLFQLLPVFLSLMLEKCQTNGSTSQAPPMKSTPTIDSQMAHRSSLSPFASPLLWC